MDMDIDLDIGIDIEIDVDIDIDLPSPATLELCTQHTKALHSRPQDRYTLHPNLQMQALERTPTPYAQLTNASP